MILNDAIKVSKIIQELKLLKLITKIPSTASLPDNMIRNLSELCIIDNNFRNDFYTIIQKLGEKYSKLLIQEISMLKESVNKNGKKD